MVPMSLSASASSSAKSGDASQGFSSTGGDYSVNYGSGVSQSQGGGLPEMVMYAALGLAVMFIWKKYK